jgi:hypothetical protein
MNYTISCQHGSECNEPPRYDNHSSDRCKFFFFFLWVRCVRACRSKNTLDSMSPLDIQQGVTTVFIASRKKTYDGKSQTTKTIGKGAQRNINDK